MYNLRKTTLQHRRSFSQSTYSIACACETAQCPCPLHLELQSRNIEDAQRQRVGYYQNAVMQLYRGLARAAVPFDEPQEWSNERVLAFLEVPSPQALLHASRLRYLGALWIGAPAIVWWMHHMEKSWFVALGKAFEWLGHNTAGLQD